MYFSIRDNIDCLGRQFNLHTNCKSAFDVLCVYCSAQFVAILFLRFLSFLSTSDLSNDLSKTRTFFCNRFVFIFISLFARCRTNKTIKVCLLLLSSQSVYNNSDNNGRIYLISWIQYQIVYNYVKIIALLVVSNGLISLSSHLRHLKFKYCIVFACFYGVYKRNWKIIKLSMITESKKIQIRWLWLRQCMCEEISLPSYKFLSLCKKCLNLF